MMACAKGEKGGQEERGAGEGGSEGGREEKRGEGGEKGRGRKKIGCECKHARRVVICPHATHNKYVHASL